jgi:DNA-binding MarR family transcriptional regulator
MYMDQASGLRKMRQNNRVKVIAVSGGKGGVGKTNVTLNVAGAMAAQGKRVMVLDADLGLANVDVMLGLRVHRNLSHVLAGECTLDDIIVEGPYGMMIVPATSGTQSMVELSPVQHAELIRAFSEMKTQVDVLLVDTAAGISDMVLSFTRAAEELHLTQSAVSKQVAQLEDMLSHSLFQRIRRRLHLTCGVLALLLTQRHLAEHVAEQDQRGHEGRRSHRIAMAAGINREQRQHHAIEEGEEQHAHAQRRGYPEKAHQGETARGVCGNLPPAGRQIGIDQ